MLATLVTDVPRPNAEDESPATLSVSLATERCVETVAIGAAVGAGAGVLGVVTGELPPPPPPPQAVNKTMVRKRTPVFLNRLLLYSEVQSGQRPVIVRAVSIPVYR